MNSGKLFAFLAFAFLVLFCILWQYRLFVAIFLAVIIAVIVATNVLSEANEMRLRNKRFHHADETPLEDQPAIPHQYRPSTYQGYQQQQ